MNISSVSYGKSRILGGSLNCFGGAGETAAKVEKVGLNGVRMSDTGGGILANGQLPEQ